MEKVHDGLCALTVVVSARAMYKPQSAVIRNRINVFIVIKIYVSKIKDNQTAAKLLPEKLQPVVCQDTTDGGVSILAASGLSLINVLCNR